MFLYRLIAQISVFLYYYAAVAISLDTDLCDSSLHRVKVHDVIPKFEDICSLTVKWSLTSQVSGSLVQRFIVQSSEGCQYNWISKIVTAESSSINLTDQALFVSCMLGECYIRVIAEMISESPADPMCRYNVTSACIGVGITFHNWTSRTSKLSKKLIS